MKLIGYAGYREDNNQLVEAFLYKFGSAPRTRLRTSDNVRVFGKTIFEIELPAGSSMDSIDGYAVVVTDLMKALAIVCHYLPDEFRGELEKRVPELTFTLPGPLNHEVWSWYQRALDSFVKAFVLTLPRINSAAVDALKLNVPNMRIM